MPEILIRCPAMGDAVPTGLDTETVVFESLPSIELPFNCPSCGGYINENRQTHGLRSKSEAAMHNLYLALTFFAVTALGFASLIALK